MNIQRTIMSDGKVNVVEDNGHGLSADTIEPRAGINLFLYHDDCQTWTRYLITSNVLGIVKGQILRFEIETHCDKCQKPIRVRIASMS